MSKGGYSPDCHYGQGIVMAFSPRVVGCLVKKGLQKGGSRTPQDPPLGTPLFFAYMLNLQMSLEKRAMFVWKGKVTQISLARCTSLPIQKL